MKREFQKLAMCIAVACMGLGWATSCSNDDNITPEPTPNGIVLESGAVLQGTYKENVSLKKGTYTLAGYVHFEANSKLTIEAGSIIKSDVSEKGALIIEPGAQLIAEGTPSNPIVFTSGKHAGSRKAGDWGGIIIMGNAPTNRITPPIVEGGVGEITYGGNKPEDNSGIIKYVRIEFAGIAATPGSEINGLTLAGVGSGTTLDYVQVSFGNDDSYEFFGGTVNAKHLIAFGTNDDCYDFDFGYTGKIQYAISQRHPKVNDTDAGNGIECDNDGTGTESTPFTRPVLSNFTFIGPNNAEGTHINQNYANRWRRSTRFVLVNSLLLGHQKGGFSMESEATASAYVAGYSLFKNNLLYAVADPIKLDNKAITAIGMNALATVTTKVKAEGTTVLDSPFGILVDAFNITAPNFKPISAASVSGASFTDLSGDSFFDQVTYKGAIDPITDWTVGWTNWDPQNTIY